MLGGTLLAGACARCDNDGPLEEAAEGIEDGVEDAADEVEDALD